MSNNMIFVWVLSFIVMMIGYFKLVTPIFLKCGKFEEITIYCLLIIGAIGYVGIPILAMFMN